jgi:DNA polymerase sigma
MSYVTLPETISENRGVGFFFGKKKKKKAKKKAKAEKKKAEEEIKKMDEEEKKAKSEEGDPSKRGDAIGARTSSALNLQSLPDWMIYASAASVVLGIYLWRKK